MARLQAYIDGMVDAQLALGGFDPWDLLSRVESAAIELLWRHRTVLLGHHLHMTAQMAVEGLLSLVASVERAVAGSRAMLEFREARGVHSAVAGRTELSLFDEAARITSWIKLQCGMVESGI